jgi:hypothetical protein
VCSEVVSIHWTPLWYEVSEFFTSNPNVVLRRVKTKDGCCVCAVWLSPQSIAAFASNLVYVTTRRLYSRHSRGSRTLSLKTTYNHFHTLQKIVLVIIGAVWTSNPTFSYSFNKHEFYCLFIISIAIKCERVILCTLDFESLCTKDCNVTLQRFKLGRLSFPKVIFHELTVKWTEITSHMQW